MAIITLFKSTNLDVLDVKPHKATHTSSSHFTTTDGAFHTDWTGSGFKYALNYPLSGTVTGGTLFQGSSKVASATGLHVDLAQIVKILKAHGDLDSIFKGTDKLIGSNGNDTVHLGGGADFMNGRNGNDSLFGGTGNDAIAGGKGNDDLHGQDGRDMLLGGLGKDALAGGLGADTFDFNGVGDSVVGTKHDLIQDFMHSQRDHIDLSSIDARIDATGNQKFTFIGALDFSHHSGELHFANGLLSGDVNGDGTADFEIAVQGVASFVTGDLVL